MADSSVCTYLEAIKEDPSLQKHLLGIVVATEEEEDLSQGQFGTDFQQIQFRNTEYTGRILDDFYDDTDDGEAFFSSLRQTCNVLCCLRHPNITQFIGIGIVDNEELPVLVMERLELSLEDVLFNTPGLSLLLKVNFMEDVCSGLVYLHHRTPALVHRNLEASNVLISPSLVAKISSTGSGLMSAQAQQQASLRKRLVSVGPSVDVWSFGLLTLHIVTQLSPDGITSSPVDNTGRKVSFDLEESSSGKDECFRLLESQMGVCYPSLVKLVGACLHDNAAQRCSSEGALYLVREVKADIEKVLGGCGIVRQLDLQKVRMTRELTVTKKRLKDLQVYQRRLEVDRVLQQCQIEDQLLELAQGEHQLKEMRDEIDSRDARIERLQKDLEKYKLRMQEGDVPVIEDEGTMADSTYSFEQDQNVGGVSGSVGGVSGGVRKSHKMNGSTNSLDRGCGNVAKTPESAKSPDVLMSPKRKISGSIKRIIKRSALTSSSDSSGSKSSESNRKRWSSSSDKENYTPMSTVPDSPTRLAGVTRQPPRGEKRYVYLNTKSGKYGFKLQSYGRVREQGKVLQTFVQSVAPGSPAFLAGLYPGDAIVEVNGLDVKYSPMDNIVEAIKKEATKGDRVLLKVVFSDGVTRVDCMKKMDDLKSVLKKRQGRLKELIQQEEKYLPPVSVIRLSSPVHTVAALDVPMWEETPPTFEPVRHTFGYNRQLNQLVGIHRDNITGLECDVLVMPCSSNQRSREDGSKNLLLQLLKTGGCRLMDQLSLSRYCKIGSNILTEGHGIRARYIYHCVFGDLEESLQSCCYKALESARTEKAATVVFWLDGFAFLSVPPQMVIETVRCWLQQDLSRNTFQKVLFSSKANADLVESIMKKTFPLFPSVSSNRGSYASSVDGVSVDGFVSNDLGKRDSVFSEEEMQIRTQDSEHNSRPQDNPL